MSILDSIKQRFSTQTKSAPRFSGFDAEENRKIFEHLERLAGVKVDRIADYDSYFDATLGKVWASYRACDMVASVVSNVSYQLVDQNGNPKVDKEIQRSLTHPNTHETFRELIYITAMQLKMTGNAYWYKERKTLGGEFELIPLYPQYVKIIPDPKKKIGKYEYTRNGATTYYKPDQIIHFKKPNPADPILGIGDIEASEVLFQDFLNQGQIRTKGLERGNIPAGVLVREEYDGDEAEWERAKSSWEKKYIGKTRGSGGIAWLTGKWNFLKIGVTPQEQESIEFEKKTEREIFLAHGVPASIAGFENATNYATARQDYINFTRFTCLPLVQLIFARINDPDEWIKTKNENYEVEFQIDGLLDVEQIVKDYKPLVDCGAMSLNELRLRCGLKTTENPDHDNYYTDSSTLTLENVTNAVPDVEQEINIPQEQITQPEAQENEAEDEEDDEEEKALDGVYGEKVESVPSYVSKNASRGLELRSKYGGGGLTPKTIREARLMSRGEVSDSKVIRMSAWFLRHESDLESPKANAYLRGETDRPTAGQVAWLLWGGDLGKSNRMRAQKWAERQANRVRDEASLEKVVDIKSIKSKSWKYNEFGYIKATSQNAKRALAYLDTHKPNWSDSKMFNGIYSVPELRGIASVLARRVNVSYRSMCKIANANRAGEKELGRAEDDTYENVDSLILDMLGGLTFVRWASEEVGD